MPKYVPHPAFDLPDAESLIWDTAPELPPPPEVWFGPDAAPSGSRRAVILLSRAEEFVLFTRLNFARMRAGDERGGVWAARARELEDAAVRYNVGLVYAAVGGGDDEAISDAMAKLLNATKYFDASRGWKFSTYATTAIHRDRSRQRAKHRPFCPDDEAMRTFQADRSVADHRASQEHGRGEDRAEQLREAIARAGLSGDEHHVMAAKLAGVTYEQIARGIGRSKEGARQLYAAALAKVRAAYLGGTSPPSDESTPSPPRPALRRVTVRPPGAPTDEADRSSQLRRRSARTGTWAPPVPPRIHPLPAPPIEPRKGSQSAALLAMLRLGGELTVDAIAARLGVTANRARVCIDKLVELGWPVKHVGLRTYAMRPQVFGTHLPCEEASVDTSQFSYDR